LHDGLRAIEQVEAVAAQVRLELLRRVRRRAGVHPDHLAVRRQHAHRAGARAREPDDQVGAGREGRPHLTDCWYSVKPIDEQMAATIQKRRMIFVSDHAISSKWWWTGAIRKTRLRKRWNENTWIRTDSASITKMLPMMRSSTSV